MDRRAFLHGIVTSVAAGAVIVAASDEDVARFAAAPGASAVLQHGRLGQIPAPRPGQHWPSDALPGGKWLLYNHRGEAVAAVERVEPRGHFDLPNGKLSYRHYPEVYAVGLDACDAWVAECRAIDAELASRRR